MAASVAPQTRRWGKRLRAPGGTSQSSLLDSLSPQVNPHFPNIFFFFPSPSTTCRPCPQIPRHPRATSWSWLLQLKSRPIRPTPRNPPDPAPPRASPPPASTHSNSSSTVGDANWPQLVDSKQGDACQREILVSRLIYKYLKTLLVMRLVLIHDGDTGAPTCSFARRPTVPELICSSWITSGSTARSSSASCFVLAASMSCWPAAGSTLLS